MTRILFVISIQLLLFSCGQESKGHNEKGTNEFKGKDLLGAWVCYERINDYGKYISQTAYNDYSNDTIPENTYWLITPDSIFSFEYPCLSTSKNSYNVKSDSLYYDGYKKTSFYIRLSNDTLILITQGGHSGPAITQKFVRTHVDMKIIKLLKKDGINLDCLKGRMGLLKKNSDESKNKTPVKLPFKMPEYFNISEDNVAHNILEKGTIMLQINGEEKQFNIVNIGWFKRSNDLKDTDKIVWEQKASIVVYPGEWWKGEKFEVTYQKE